MWTKVIRSVTLCNIYSFSLRIYTGYFGCFYNCWVGLSNNAKNFGGKVYTVYTLFQIYL